MRQKIFDIINEFETRTGRYPTILLIGEFSLSQLMQELQESGQFVVLSPQDMWGGHYYNMEIVPVKYENYCRVI